MDRADAIIFGGGLVGLARASALDSSGVSTILVDPADPSQRRDAAFDGRTSAVSSSSMRMLDAIGVAGHLAEPGCPIQRIAVADGLEPGGLHFDSDDEEPLGFMHENRHLRAALQARAEAGKNIWLMGGGGLIASFLDAGAIDEFIVSIVPVFIGEGIPLIAPQHRHTPLSVRSVKSFPDGVVQVHYDVLRPTKSRRE